MVHRLRDLRDLDEALKRKMSPRLHHAKDRHELRELIGFSRSEWISFEERNDLRSKVIRIEDDIHDEVFPVVVPPAVTVDASAPDRSPSSREEHGRFVHLAPPRNEAAPAIRVSCSDSDALGS